MKLTRPSIAVIVLVVITLIGQLPGVTHWYQQIALEYPHLLILIEGILGIVAVIWSAFSGETPVAMRK
jgi:hypothetical protein